MSGVEGELGHDQIQAADSERDHEPEQRSPARRRRAGPTIAISDDQRDVQCARRRAQREPVPAPWRSRWRAPRRPPSDRRRSGWGARLGGPVPMCRRPRSCPRRARRSTLPADDLGEGNGRDRPRRPRGSRSSAVTVELGRVDLFSGRDLGRRRWRSSRVPGPGSATRRTTPPGSGGSSVLPARASTLRSTSSPPKTLLRPRSSTSVVARTTLPARGRRPGSGRCPRRGVVGSVNWTS